MAMSAETKDIIRAIVENVSKGYYFDAHYVIQQLKKRVKGGGNLYVMDCEYSMAVWHSLISRQVNSLIEEGIVEKVNGKSYSLSEQDTYMPNNLWIKKKNKKPLPEDLKKRLII